MKRTNHCPKCQCENIIEDAKGLDQNGGMGEGHLHVAWYRKPDAFLFKGKVTASVSAWICTECGYIELYANPPQKF